MHVVYLDMHGKSWVRGGVRVWGRLCCVYICVWCIAQKVDRRRAIKAVLLLCFLFTRVLDIHTQHSFLSTQKYIFIHDKQTTNKQTKHRWIFQSLPFTAITMIPLEMVDPTSSRQSTCYPYRTLSIILVGKMMSRVSKSHPSSSRRARPTWHSTVWDPCVTND